MARRSRWPIPLAVLLGVLLGLGAAAGWQFVSGARSPTVTAEVCDVDPTLSGLQGYCVQRRVRGGGPFTDPVAQVWIVARQDGADLPRYTYLPLPTTDVDGRFEVAFTADDITISLDDDVQLVIPEEHYRLD